LTGGISILLPLADRNQGNIEAAVARQRAARLRRESLERVVRQEVMSAAARLAASRSALQLFEAGVIGQSQENLRVVRGAYQLGELRLLDVINEQRRLIDTQRAHTELLRDAYAAMVELERAIGARVN
jgi:cobalt-zinc-cadmium efflux system outer membrane protein